MEKGIKKGYISFNEANYDDKDNFFVRKPHLFLQMLTGIEWEVQKANQNYIIQNGDYIIEYWSANGGRTGHFARIIQRKFNSLEYSNSIKNGNIDSYRIFRVVK